LAEWFKTLFINQR